MNDLWLKPSEIKCSNLLYCYLFSSSVFPL